MKCVSSTSEGVYLVHVQGQRPVEGVAVYSYDLGYGKMWQCEKCRPRQCTHIHQAKQATKVGRLNVQERRNIQ
jgi:hypothetical protein